VKSNLAQQIAEDGEPEQPRAILWLCVPGQAPVPFIAVPFDDRTINRPKGQTDRLLREARELAARKAARSVGGGGRARDRDSDLQTVWETQKLQRGGLGPREWTEPAAKLGVTQREAAKLYGRTAGEARKLYRWAPTLKVPTVGSRDSFDCWYATKAQLERAWGEPARRRQAEATAAPHMSRTEQRIARRRAKHSEGAK
jgi:hypothetical protein